MDSTERDRLKTLHSYDIFGTPPEPEYDQLTELGARLFDVPICVISLIGARASTIKSHHGMAGVTLPREQSVCEFTLACKDPLVIPDLAADPRVAGRAAAASGTLRFYAGAPIIDPNGRHLGAFCLLDTKPRSDFSDAQKALLGMLAAMVMARIERRRFDRSDRAVSGFANASGMGLITANARGVITFWNHAAETIFGWSAAEMIGASIDRIVPSAMRGFHQRTFKRVSADGHSKLAGKTVEVVGVRKDGSAVPIELTVAIWEGRVDREFGAFVQDITERREREKRLQHLATHDSVTGLMNRTGFRNALDEQLATGKPAALLACDLDGFRAISDSLGHATGYTALQAVALRLHGATAEGSRLARIGGDVFAVLIPCDAVADIVAHDAAHALRDAFAEPFRIAGHTIELGLAIGMAILPIHGGDADEALVHADLALMEAKRAGGSKIRRFDAVLGSTLAAHRAFADDLRLATERGEWQLFYQPQMRLSDGAPLGVEALLRWRHPQRGLLAPAAFLPVLETHAVAPEVGGWVLDEACRQLAAWRAAGRRVPRVGVNLFAAQFASHRLEQAVSETLARHGLNPGDLEIEVTETIALRPDHRVISTLGALRDKGVGIALDDFGTGFASLSTLKQVAATRLKIDKSFVRDICEDRHSEAIVCAMVTLAQSLGLEVIAEGIETVEQRDHLLSLGCDAGQGFLLGRPAGAGALSFRRDGPMVAREPYCTAEPALCAAHGG